MAEIIEFRIEETIPELETMLQLLFERNEIQSITQLRKEFEYRLHRTPRRKEDFLKYIQNEIKLLKMIKLRHKKKGIQKNAKLNNLESSFTNRINSIFICTLRWFPEDLRTWISYIRFCRQMRLFTSTSRVMQQMLKVHGAKNPELYRVAANWEFNDCKNSAGARALLFTGIQQHPNNKRLLLEAFKFELEDTARLRKNALAKGAIDPNNPLMTTKKAECLYNNTIRKMNDMELTNDALQICSDYDFTQEIDKKIVSDITKLGGHERMWDIITIRQYLKDADKEKPKKKIAQCAMMYEEAVKRLNTEKMWSYYLEQMIDINNKDSSVLPNFKRKLLLTALTNAEQNVKLSEKYYVVWVSLLQAPEKRKKLIEVLQSAVKNLPESVNLWQMLLRTHLMRGEDKPAKQVFKEGVLVLGKQSLPLWKLMLHYEQLKKNNKIEELFKEGWIQPAEISRVLRPRYLEWLVLTHGISAARKTYLEEGKKPPPCPDMHKKMIFLETIQPNISLKCVRKAYAAFCCQFGDERIDAWVDWIKFEKLHDPFKIREIYYEALKTLPQPLTDTFLTEVTLLNISPEMYIEQTADGKTESS